MTQVTCATPKQDIFLSLAELAQAVGHVNRLDLLEHLVAPMLNNMRGFKLPPLSEE